MLPWHVRKPGALERELAAFDAQGYAAEIDQGPPGSDDVVIGVAATVAGRDFSLRVYYPDSYPFLRPHVLLEDQLFDRHQNPVDKNLCLLDRSTRAWRTGMTAAGLIAEQLPKLLEVLEMEPGERTGLEAPQGEPLSVFLRAAPVAVVLIPEFPEAVKTAERGRGTIRLLDVGPSLDRGPLRGLLTTLTATDEAGRNPHRLGRADEPLIARVHGETLSIRWVRLALEARDIEGDASAERLLALAEERQPAAARLEHHPLGGARVAVLGIVFKEEIQLNEYDDAWAFVVSVQPDEGSPLVYLVRGERASRNHLLARIPSVAALADKTVALVGLGALGAPAAMEFARAQVGSLRILDFDYVEVGTTVRWISGLDAAMHPKTYFVENTILRNYPYIEVTSLQHQLGLARAASEQPEREVLERLLDGADLLLDLTAERGINYLLSSLASEAGVPQIYAWGTEGGWGGAVARVIPGRTGCWFCLMLRLDDKSICPPPTDVTATFQPSGCGSLTYTGTAFDLLPVVAQCVRLAIQTLVHESQDGYPDSRTDVMVLALRTREGMPITPKWTEYELRPHDSCPYCRAAFS